VSSAFIWGYMLLRFHTIIFFMLLYWESLWPFVFLMLF
jgi:hypothetical protein